MSETLHNRDSVQHLNDSVYMCMNSEILEQSHILMYETVFATKTTTIQDHSLETSNQYQGKTIILRHSS